MAVKKKAPRKTSKKTSAKASSGFGDSLRRTSKKMVDKVLVQISPQLQDKIDHLIKTLESSKDTKVNDISLMASKILMRAQDISRNLRMTQKKTGKKR